MGGKFGIDRGTAIEVCQPKEPTATLLYTSGAKVLNKYDVMSKFAPEIALIAALVMWQTTTVSILSTIAEKNKIQSKRESKLSEVPRQAAE